MKRRWTTILLFLPLLTCLLGADSVDWADGMPAGGKQTISGSGPFTVDPNHTFNTVVFTTSKGRVGYDSEASSKDGVWSASHTVQAGTYDCHATLIISDGAKLLSKKSTIKQATATQ